MKVTRTLGELAEWYDEVGFVGRGDELDVIDRLLGRTNGGVVLVHGPGGIGKSALLRETARRAGHRGRPVLALDLRDATPTPSVLDPLRDAVSLARPVVTLDTFEHVAALSGLLRSQVLPALPIGALVLIASRLPPDSAWTAGAWGRLTTELPLAPLTTVDATALLHARGLVEPDAVRRALQWTGGNPLGLALAAEHAGQPGQVGPSEDLSPPVTVAVQLTRRLLDRADRDALQHTRALVVASIARVTTPQLLRTVLDDAPAADLAWTWLTQRSFISASGDGVAPHELLSRAVRAEVRANSPGLESGLRRRVVDVLAADALAGGRTGTADLVHLVDNAAIRWGFGVNASTHHLDRLSADDLETVRTTARFGPYLPMLEPWLHPGGPGVYVVRHAGGAIAGIGVAFSSTHAPDAAWEDPFVGPRLAHARDHVAGAAVVWHCSVTADEDPGGAVQGLLGIGGYLVTDTPNPVASYVVVTPTVPAALQFAAAVGGVRLGDLDARLADGRAVQVHVINHGPAGMVEHIHRTVYQELGLSGIVPSSVRTGSTPVQLDDLRSALREWRSDAGLADSALAAVLLPAPGHRRYRAEQLRTLLTAAIEAAWPDPAALERQALDAAYLHPTPGPPGGPLHMSRSSWFRLVRRALDGVLDELVAAGP